VVLLGDVVELRQGPVRDALATASRVLSEVGGAMGAGRELVIVSGNHDHHLLADFVARRSAAGPPPAFELETAVEWADGEPLAALAVAAGASGTEVSVRYPGVWLREDVWATHGHYLDVHTTIPIFERLGAGVTGRVLRRRPGEAHRIEDYEGVLAPVYAWINAVAQAGDDRTDVTADGASERIWRALTRSDGRRLALRQRGLGLAVAGTVAALNRAGIGPLKADFGGPELRRASLLALGDVVEQLSVGASYVVFGHSHRAGPLPGDDRREWVASGGARIINTGCWVQESAAFLGEHPERSPYRAGFAVRVGDEGPPELVNLLD
jgi:hypothetical protein